VPYEIKNVDGHVFSCTCMAWKMQKGAGSLRTCKHIRGLLGEKADALRMGAPASPFTAAAPKKKRAKPTPGETPAATSVTDLVSLAEAYKPEKHAVSGYVVSEKLDGMRCIIRGGSAYSRQGNLIHTPSYFLEGIAADACLDGELFLGRGRFQVRASEASANKCPNRPSAAAAGYGAPPN
jgi:DNA ligase-1